MEVKLINRLLVLTASLTLFPSLSPSQATQGDASDSGSKHIFGIVPNFRTAPLPNPYVPVSTREKFVIARQDSFDRGTLALAAVFAGESQLTNQNRAFGQGVEGYSKYFGGAYADFVIGNFMTEAIFPTVIHQDPRYFRRGTGTKWSRLGYSVREIVWTHKDSGGTEFNYSEFAGNSTAVAISNLYYKDNRNVKDAVSQLSLQLAVDTANNILKEFWPDIDHRLKHRHGD